MAAITRRPLRAIQASQMQTGPRNKYESIGVGASMVVLNSIYNKTGTSIPVTIIP